MSNERFQVASGYIYFTCPTRVSAVIHPGMRVSTGNGLVFYTNESADFWDARYNVDYDVYDIKVKVYAENYGSKYNVLPGSIKEIVDPIETFPVGVQLGVENREHMQGGNDLMLG